MRTVSYVVYPVGASPFRGKATVSDETDVDELKEIVEPLLGYKRMAHVSVLRDGKLADMFVDGYGSLSGLPVNSQATDFYLAHWESQHPGATPRKPLPQIYGVAVVFDQSVWRTTHPEIPTSH